MLIEAQEGDHRAEDRQRDDEHRRTVRVQIDDAADDEREDRERPRQSVDAVDAIEGVGDADEPEHRDRERQGSERPRFRTRDGDRVDAEAVRDDGHRRERLRGELEHRSEAAEVVDDPRGEDDTQRDDHPWQDGGQDEVGGAERAIDEEGRERGHRRGSEQRHPTDARHGVRMIPSRPVRVIEEPILLRDLDDVRHRRTRQDERQDEGEEVEGEHGTKMTIPERRS
jgi:hypothetical protein